VTIQPVVSALFKIITNLLDFLPLLVNGVLLLIIGTLLSMLIRGILRFILRRIQLDQLFERIGITQTVHSLGVHLSLADLLAQVIFFFLLLSFITSAVNLMQFTTIASVLQGILNFIPRAISAAIIVIFGAMFARFLGTTIQTLSGSVRLSYGRALGRVIEYTVVAFVVVLAISTLGVDTTILTTGLALIVASAGLALALTFALGARESARHVVAGFYVRQRFRPGQWLIMENYSGTIRTTLGTYTVVEINTAEGEQQTLSLPNAMLLQQIVRTQDQSIPGNSSPPDEGSREE
jgi:small-conductance mechanosensitive channel